MQNTPGRQLYAYIPDYTVFDLETTGTSTQADAVIEISALQVLGGVPAAEFTALIDPCRPIPYYASAVNGITDDMVRGKPTIDEVLPAFFTFIGESVLVGHNIRTFDLPFIYRDSMRYFGRVPGNDFIDTLPLARRLLPALPHHRLTDLAACYGVATDGAHRALYDCRMNQAVFEQLGKALQKEEENAPRCPKCGAPLLRRSGRFGDFFGCRNYPDCRFTKNI